MSAPAQCRALAGRGVQQAVRDRGQVVSALVIPLVYLLGFYGPMHRVMQARGIDYAQYFPVVIVIQSAFFTAIGSALAVGEDRRLLRRIRTMPVAGIAPLAGRLAADLAKFAAGLVVLLAAASMLGFRFHNGLAGAVGFVAVAAWFTVATCTAASALAAGRARAEAVAQALMAVQMVLVLLSTGFVPATDFPAWLQPLVRWQPVSVAVDTMRGLASGVPAAGAVAATACWLGVGTLAAALLAARSFRSGGWSG
ncbi:ABC transporter permease [Pseudonocardia acaciae]|uniref:ABC transporter permease n=1 Tax=Pseudonocardia acaciae TaxID=551276 RepID=UPI00048B935C|nr:ABC transporter permease [Pseudonocardia acaciae]